MKEKEPQFTVIDRRKFTSEGEMRPDTTTPEEREQRAAEEAVRKERERVASIAPAPAATPAAASGIHAVPAPETSRPSASTEAAVAVAENGQDSQDEQAPFEGPTEEESAQSHAAYTETTRQMDEILRTKIPGGMKDANIGFEHVVQSLYMTAVMHLGAGTPQGEKARIDLMGARQTIDMLEILQKKTAGNLNENEKRMMDSALFEARMMFLEITNAIARNATQQGGPLQPPPHPLDPRGQR